MTYRDADVTAPAVLVRAFCRGMAEGAYLLATGAERGQVANRRLIRERVFRGVPRRIARHAADTDDPRVILLAGAGELTELVGMAASFSRPAPGKLPVLFGRPAGTLLIALSDRERGRCLALSLLRYDLATGDLHEAALPPALALPTGDGASRPLASELGLDTCGFEPPTRFAIDDVFMGRFGIGVDDYLLLAYAPAGTTTDGLTRALEALASARRLPRLLTALRRGDARTSLPVAALLLLFRGIRRTETGNRTQVAVDEREGEPFAEFAARVRAVVAPTDSPRHRTPRDALKLVEWA